MYKEHQYFEQPRNESEKVWRFMDFTKLISLLESSSLYFSCADKFEDPFEGSYPREDVSAVEDFLRKDEFSNEEQKNMIRKLWNGSNFRKSIFINCWHLNNHESAAMWKLYLKSSEGIAIQSTYQKLKNSFESEQPVYLGQVKYIDYETEWLGFPRNALNPFVHKRKSFEHEKEVRAIAHRLFEKNDNINGNKEFEIKPVHGLHIPINLDVLIEKIYVAPNAEIWFLDIVKSILKRYDKTYEVIQSSLYDSPIY